MPNLYIFFSQKGTQNSQSAADYQSANFKYKTNIECAILQISLKKRSEEGSVRYQ